MALTYEPIQTYTASGSTFDITFDSIPSTYTDLILIIQGGANAAEDVFMRFNSDTASNYSFTSLQGNGTAASSQRGSSQTSIKLNSPNGGVFGTTLNTNMIVQIQNYANTTTFKTALIRANLASSGTNATVGLWRKTPEAINSIKILTGSANILSNSTFSLYGIKAA